jgi:hypothetical protein
MRKNNKTSFFINKAPSINSFLKSNDKTSNFQVKTVSNDRVFKSKLKFFCLNILKT